MPFTAEEDIELGDAHFVVSGSQNFVRATIQTYEKAASYIFLNVFKKTEQEYEFQQRIKLTHEEFQKLMKKFPKIRSTASNTNDTDITAKAPPAKKRKLKQKDHEHEISE